MLRYGGRAASKHEVSGLRQWKKLPIRDLFNKIRDAPVERISRPPDGVDTPTQPSEALGVEHMLTKQENYRDEIMWTGSDVDIAVPIVEITKELFPDFCAASFDRGFHSPANRDELRTRGSRNASP